MLVVNVLNKISHVLIKVGLLIEFTKNHHISKESLVKLFGIIKITLFTIQVRVSDEHTCTKFHFPTVFQS